MQSGEACEIVRVAEHDLWTGLHPFLTSLRNEVHDWSLRLEYQSAPRKTAYQEGDFERQQRELEQVMRECWEWVSRTSYAWREQMKGLWPLRDTLGKYSQHAILSDDEALAELTESPQYWSSTSLEIKLSTLEELLDKILVHKLALGSSLRIFDFDPSLSLQSFHPPRYARLHEGINESLYVQDLEREVELGRHYAQHLGQFLDLFPSDRIDLEPDIDRWIEECTQLLRGIKVPDNSLDAGRDPAKDFQSWVPNWKACYSNLIADKSSFAVSIISLGVNYLEEVQKNMPDYLESDQNPQYAITINGGTIYGPVAMKIEAINSTIAGVMEQGAADLGKALKALEEAILADTTNNEELRQDLLDNLEVLAEEAQAEPRDRKRGIIKSTLASLKNAALSGPEIAKALEAWGQVLSGITP